MHLHPIKKSRGDTGDIHEWSFSLEFAPMSLGSSLVCGPVSPSAGTVTLIEGKVLGDTGIGLIFLSRHDLGCLTGKERTEYREAIGLVKPRSLTRASAHPFNTDIVVLDLLAPRLSWFHTAVVGLDVQC
jgi:hypothetical protein